MNALNVDAVVGDVQKRLLPMLAELDRLLEIEENEQPRVFFAQISEGIRIAQVADDLVVPFMQLSTSAFQGFTFEFSTTQLLDRILEGAQTVSWTLSANEETSH